MTDYAATQLKAIFLQVAGGDISVMEQSLGVDSDTVVWEQLFLEELKIPYILQHIVPKNRVLIDLLANNVSTMSAFHLAAVLGQGRVLGALLGHGIAVGAALQTGLTVLHLAAFAGHVHEARILISSCGADVNSQDCNGRTPLYFACVSGHLGMVRYLVEEAGCDVTILNNDALSAEFCAEAYDHGDIVRYLRNNNSSSSTFPRQRQQQQQQQEARSPVSRQPTQLLQQQPQQQESRFLVAQRDVAVAMAATEGMYSAIDRSKTLSARTSTSSAGSKHPSVTPLPTCTAQMTRGANQVHTSGTRQTNSAPHTTEYRFSLSGSRPGSSGGDAGAGFGGQQNSDAIHHQQTPVATSVVSEKMYNDTTTQLQQDSPQPQESIYQIPRTRANNVSMATEANSGRSTVANGSFAHSNGDSTYYSSVYESRAAINQSQAGTPAISSMSIADWTEKVRDIIRYELKEFFNDYMSPSDLGESFAALAKIESSSNSELKALRSTLKEELAVYQQPLKTGTLPRRTEFGTLREGEYMELKEILHNPPPLPPPLIPVPATPGPLSPRPIASSTSPSATGGTSASLAGVTSDIQSTSQKPMFTSPAALLDACCQRIVPLVAPKWKALARVLPIDKSGSKVEAKIKAIEKQHPLSLEMQTTAALGEWRQLLQHLGGKTPSSPSSSHIDKLLAALKECRLTEAVAEVDTLVAMSKPSPPISAVQQVALSPLDLNTRL